MRGWGAVQRATGTNGRLRLATAPFEGSRLGQAVNRLLSEAKLNVILLQIFRVLGGFDLVVPPIDQGEPTAAIGPSQPPKQPANSQRPVGEMAVEIVANSP